MPKKGVLSIPLLILVLVSITSQTALAQNAKLWVSKGQVRLDEGIELNLVWNDVGCPEYHVVLLRTYPNGTTIRIPPEGYGEPLKAPGITPMKLRLEGERTGKHVLKYELYCGTNLITISNEVEVIVIKGNSSLKLYASLERLLKGGSVELKGSIIPKVSGKVTLEVLSPSGSERSISLDSDGNFSYNMVLNESGTWRFRAFWGGNSDYFGASSDWITVYVSEKPIKVQIRTEPQGLRVKIDGRTYEGGGEFEWVEGSTHNLSAEEVITSGGTRYLFTGWRGKGSSKNLSIKVEHPEVYVAEYKVQYYLNVTSELGEVEGSGWYDAGSYARASLKQGKFESDFPWIYIFSGWGGDARGEGLTSEPILMDGPKSAVARWERRIDPYGLALIVAAVLAFLFGLLSIYLLHKYRKVSGRVRAPASTEEERIRRIKEKMTRLEEMRKRGEVPERVYRRLKEEYSLELKRTKEGRRGKG